MRRGTLFLILLFLPFVHALEGDFVEGLPIIPPTLPGQETTTIELFNAGGKITNSHVLAELKGSDEISTIVYVDESGKLELPIRRGSWKVLLKVDKVGTKGKDFFYDGPLTTEESLTVLPAGTLSGLLFDKGGAVIPNAKVRAMCGGSLGKQQVTSDAFGSFEFEWLPVGNCKIHASSSEMAGFEETIIIQGEIADLRITLDTPIAGKKSFTIWIIIIVLLLIICGVFAMLWQKNRNPQVQIPVKSSKTPLKEEPVRNRAEDILKTLSSKERQVVEFLLQNPSSYQNKVIYATNIPKTTMLRLLESLSSKNIVSVQKEGKIKRLTLTNWFLER